jgi:hypothetical protein
MTYHGVAGSRLPHPNEKAHTRSFFKPRVGAWRLHHSPSVIRITAVNSNGLTLIVEGQLSGPAVDELRKSCAGSRGIGVVVDVSGVVFADSLAASLLKELSAAGFVIQGCSDFIKELLR